MPFPASVGHNAAMSMMHSQLYDALINAGADEEPARAAATAVASNDHVATKADLAQLERRITLRLAGWAPALTAIAVAILLAGVRWMLAPLLGG